jgi:hypothetical protein
LQIAAQENNSVSPAGDSLSKVESTRKKNYSGPRKASIMSVILPGLGQAYNKKYWKIPIIYAGLGGFGYMFVTNNEQYNFYRKNLIAENDEDPNTLNTTRYSSDQLQVQKVAYRKSRDFAALGIAIMYILNIVDANVDAHLKTFDVSDDLSFQIKPWQTFYYNGTGYANASGLSLKLYFK